ncbi:IS200/IS605 family transposase [Priestia sp. SB1]|uniref:IS200/IS605 family transposase n=1 Tax=Priestia aryabhattai TaxID=412384 RepID=A0AAX6NDD6_PRIAR|nr:IS200/IS605 family transposase [Priestia aryabhattai]MDU9693807.1 IS200/IS605 family transposase [Priestia aryabhattai]
MIKFTEKKFHSKVIHSCKYQVVWCTHNQRDILKDGVELRLKEIIEETMSEVSGEILELEILPEQVHLTVAINPQYGIDKLVRHLKRESSAPLRNEFPAVKSRVPSTWTSSYYVCTLDSTTKGAIEEYLSSQKTK